MEETKKQEILKNLENFVDEYKYQKRKKIEEETEKCKEFYSIVKKIWKILDSLIEENGKIGIGLFKFRKDEMRRYNNIILYRESIENGKLHFQLNDYFISYWLEKIEEEFTEKEIEKTKERWLKSWK